MRFETFPSPDCRVDLVYILSAFHDAIRSSESADDMLVELPCGWKMNIWCDMASCGGLVCIEWIETPKGDRKTPEEIGEWFDGYCDGFIDAMSLTGAAVRSEFQQEDN
jgi:hypothetical protein